MRKKSGAVDGFVSRGVRAFGALCEDSVVNTSMISYMIKMDSGRKFSGTQRFAMMT